eukprot:360440-Chlamydomonas_euryale.AAC.4
MISFSQPPEGLMFNGGKILFYLVGPYRYGKSVAKCNVLVWLHRLTPCCSARLSTRPATRSPPPPLRPAPEHLQHACGWNHRPRFEALFGKEARLGCQTEGCIEREGMHLSFNTPVARPWSLLVDEIPGAGCASTHSTCTR